MEGSIGSVKCIFIDLLAWGKVMGRNKGKRRGGRNSQKDEKTAYCKKNSLTLISTTVYVGVACH